MDENVKKIENAQAFNAVFFSKEKFNELPVNELT